MGRERHWQWREWQAEYSVIPEKREEGRPL